MTALLQRRAQVSVAVTLLAGMLLLLLAGQYVYFKHVWAQETLGEIEPRYARLLGLKGAGVQLDQALKDAKTELVRLGYPAQRDAAQAGNDLQQVVRRGLEAARVTVSSSQVLATRNENGFDRVSVAVQAEGPLSRLQTALAALWAETPVISMDGLVIQPAGRFAEDGSPVVSCRITVSVLRLQS
jgi:general secretion pathway protein M